MTGWDLSVPGINGVLKDVMEIAGDLEGQVEKYGGHLESAAGYAGTLAMPGEPVPEAGLIGAALAEFAEATQEDLMFVAARAGKSLQGASDATSAYLTGDLDMAAAAQAEALKAPELDLPGQGQGQGE
ncbi:DUF6507 family protein [Streptomyces chumphonensis]|uniref:DUF6507 family protein n=1 Tax=Streptomyces chumphonensis TaxID=1214925 RepID=UPI003D75776B